MEPEHSKWKPFSQPTTRIQRSVDIIREAKESLAHPHLRSLSTRRPETPMEETRRLFRQYSAGDLHSRPPSSFSLSSQHFDAESRPCSGTRLSPLDHKARTPLSDADIRVAPRPPHDPNRPLRRLSSRSRLLHCHPLDLNGVQEQHFTSIFARSESLNDDFCSVLFTRPGSPDGPDSTRRVHSGPTTRTRTDDTNQQSTDVSELRVTTGHSKNGHCDVINADGKSQGRRPHRNENQDDISPDLRSQPTIPGARRMDQHSAGSSRNGHTRKVRSAGSQSGRGGGREGLTEEEMRRDSLTVGGSSSTRGEGEAERGTDESYYDRVIAPLVNQIADNIQSKDADKLIELTNRLYSLLDDGGVLGKSCPNRQMILKTLYKMLDHLSPRLMLKSARLILALRVSGHNLLNICKLVFKVAHDNKNDIFFLEENILDLMIETARNVDATTNAETLTYCIGSLKFVSSNTTVVKSLATRQHIESVAKILATINKSASDESGNPRREFIDVLVQLTVLLRNLSDVTGTRKFFLSLNLIDELSKVMDRFKDDPELMLNISRIFSKLTLHTDCCTVLAANPTNFRSFVEILQRHCKREDLVLRVCFIVGNLTAKQDSARQYLYAQPKSFDILLAVLRFYADKDVSLNEDRLDGGQQEAIVRNQKKVEDILIKVVRIIANISITPEIGQIVATSDECVDLLIQILVRKSLELSEDLILTTMATINNLSFYDVKTNSVTKKRLQIAQLSLKFLTYENTEGLMEATRVLGNLTKERNVRDFLVKNKVDEAIVSLLDSGNTELVFIACGVLINLMVDDDKRPLLRRHGGVNKLIDVLGDVGRTDWLLAGMVCQTLWNYSTKIASTNACFGEEAAQELTSLLIEYLDEETAIDESSIDGELREFTISTWKTEFCQVASDLLHRIETHQSNFEPLPLQPK